MSRLDYRRKRQKALEREQSGKTAFSAFVKAHTGLIALIVIVVLVGAAAVLIGVNPDFKERFVNRESTSLYLDENTIFEMPLTAAREKTVIASMGSSLVICNGEKIMMLSDSGKTQWELDAPLNKPILSVCGDYILAADRGGRDIYLINNGRVILKTLSLYSIINAKASSDGKFVVVSDEPYFKGLVTVKDAADKEVFVWHSGGAYIVDASIGADTNKLAVAVLNTNVQTEEGSQESFSGGVLMFNLYDAEPYKTHMFDGCLTTNVFRAGKGFVAVTDKKTVVINADGEIVNEYGYGGKSVNKMCKSDDMTVFSFEDESGRKSIAAIDNDGKKRCDIDVRQTPNFLSAESGRIAYGGGNEVVICDGAGTELYLIQTAKNFETLTFLGGARCAAALTASSVDIIEIK